MYWLRKSEDYKQRIPQLQNCTKTNLGLRNTTLGNRIHVQHRNTRTLPVEGSAHDNGRTMLCAKYGNMERYQNPNGYTGNQPFSYHYNKRICAQMN
jgi:hypothetical protein